MDMAAATLFIWLLGHDEGRRLEVTAEKQKHLKARRAWIGWIAQDRARMLKNLGVPVPSVYSPQMLSRIALTETSEALDELDRS